MTMRPLVFALLVSTAQAFVLPSPRDASSSALLATRDDNFVSRRQTLEGLFAGMLTASIALPALAQEEASFTQQYEDFIKIPNGVSYREVTVGKGDKAAKGDRVVYDWSGYTIGMLFVGF
jgi:hypothetical protein